MKPIRGSPPRRAGVPLPLIGLVLAVAFFLPRGAAPADAAAPAQSNDDIIKFLDETIDWYRGIEALDENAASTEELLYRQAAREQAREAVRLAFQFARARATLLEAGTQAAGPSTNTANATSLDRAASAATQRLADLNGQLDQANQQVARASPTSLPALTARRDKLSAELDLAAARRDALQDLVAFKSASASGASGDLAARIDELERSVPQVQAGPGQPGTAAPAPATAPGTKASAVPAPAAEFRPESSGIFSLLNATLTLPGQLNELKAAADRAGILDKLNDTLRAAARGELTDLIHQADAISSAPDTDDPARLAEQREQIEALSAKFKLLAGAAVPLSEQDVVLRSARASLLQWRQSLGRDYTRAVRYLIIRLGAMTGAIVLVLIVSKLWRHAVFRYVGDLRRRRHFLVVRRLVVGALVVAIVLFTFVTEFASLATFAGILTAGIAVALQTFIVSGVAYFFFVGRYGVRVGERVTIANITGDVVEIGLFRLYLMELGGTGLDRHPTGRIVVFSNSVLFQPSAFFKQVPGADYTWHQVSMTLAPDSDSRAAQRRLMSVVESIFGEYQADIDRQHASVSQSIHVPIPPPRPEARLRFVEAGVDLVIRYPVDIRQAPEIDDRMGRRLIEEIHKEPALKLLGAGVPRIGPAD